MSIKDLFNEPPKKVLTSKTLDEVGKTAESERFVNESLDEKTRFQPELDYTNPEEFAKFGSAEEYYVASIERVYKTYPYDGSRYEKSAWMNSSSYLDLHIFENWYPRTNGYGIITPGSWGSAAATISTAYEYVLSSTKEYIFFKGGPNPDPDNDSIKDSFPDIEKRMSGSRGANLFDLSKNRESNLKIGGIEGNTVEFWLKKINFVKEGSHVATNEVIFDCYTTSSISSSIDYARMRVEFSEDDDTQPFRITYMSGTNGAYYVPIGDTATKALISDDDWHHFAITVKTTGSLGKVHHPKALSEQANSASLEIKLFVDGECDDTVVTGSTVDYVSGAMVATVGSLVASVSGTNAAQSLTYANGEDMQKMRGYGKLSGSIDEFRFWKVERPTELIGRYMRQPVGAGTNIDEANTQLGVYFKFNEGITGVTATDAVVLDYAGRLSNGEWTGYSANSRNTGSAIVESSASLTEFKDPIIYSYHPDVESLIDEKRYVGREYDKRNAGSLYFSFPEWITSEDSDGGEQLLKLTQIMASYFDTLSLQIKSLTDIKSDSYVTSSVSGNIFKPVPFADKLLEHRGFITSDIFADADVLENFLQRDEDRLFSEDLHDVKNLIYKNIYNNLSSIYKAKGTENAFRNLIRCFGVDDELVKINLYANNLDFELKDRFVQRSVAKKCIDFSRADNHGAVIYQHTSSIPQSIGYITGSLESSTPSNTFPENGLGQTFECEVILPKQYDIRGTRYHYYSDVTSSIFGAHRPRVGTDHSWTTSINTDYVDFQVFTIRDKANSANGYFMLTGSRGAGFIPELTSSLIHNLYDNLKWNLAVRIKPNTHPFSDTVSGSTDAVTLNESGTADKPHYDVEFYGVNMVSNVAQQRFFVSGTMTHQAGDNFLSSPKKIFAGAHRENFTGSIQQNSDVKVSSVRAWMDYINNDVIDAHAKDVSNYGTLYPYESAYLFENADGNMEKYLNESTAQGQFRRVPQIKTLALNWNFSQITGSNSSGQFFVADASSGSATTSLDSDGKVTTIPVPGRYGWIENVIEHQHTARGDKFPTNSTSSHDIVYLNSFEQKGPEMINSADMVNVLTQDDVTFTRETRPTNYYVAIEKSMYQSISEEMLNFFATIKGFNNLIGENVNRYRMNYKHMEKLRELFFQRVKNTPDLDKYVTYYRWLDSSLGEMLQQLFPASADHSDRLRTVVESHVLERNKYWNKYPTIEQRSRISKKHQPGRPTVIGLDGVPNEEATRTVTDALPPDLEAHIERDEFLDKKKTWTDEGVKPPGFNEDREGNAGPDNNKDTGDADGHGWHSRHDPGDGDSSNTSGDDTVDSKRSDFLAAKYSKATVNNVFNGTGGNFNVDLKMSPGVIIKGGHNQPSDTGGQTDALNPATIFGGLDSDSKPSTRILVVSGSVTLKGLEKPTTKNPKVRLFPEVISKATNVKSNKFLEGIAAFYTNSSGVEITNIHQDYDIGYEKPLQSVFTERFVGGRPHRKEPVGDSVNDTILTRPEFFRISGSASHLESTYAGGDKANISIFPADSDLDGAINYNLPRSFFNKGTKSPINIENIQMTTASSDSPGTNIGNYQNVYELAQTSGRRLNNKWLSLNASNISSSTAEVPYFTGSLDFSIPVRSTQNKVIVERFSAPGGFEVSSRGYLDTAAEELSVYNVHTFRNHNVLNSSGSQASTDTNGPMNISVKTDFHTNNDGLRQVLSRRSGRFGVDGEYGTVGASDYETTASYHKTHRNVIRRIENSTAGNITASVFNNYFVNHAIPRTELQYAWVTSSIKSNHKLIEFTSTNKSYDGMVSGAGGFEPAIDFSEGKFPKYGNFFSDAVGLNTLVVDTVLTASNTLSSSVDYRNSDVISAGSFAVGNRFNILMKHRSGPYQGASWKLNTKDSHPIVRYQRKNNVLDIIETDALPNKPELTNYANDPRLKRDIRSFTVTSVTNKYKPVEFEVGIPGEEPVEIDQSFGNELEFMPDDTLDYKLGLDQVAKAKKTQYDSFKSVIQSPSNQLQLSKLTYSETIYPREENAFLAKARGRISYTETQAQIDSSRLGDQRTFWRDGVTDRKRTSGTAKNTTDKLQVLNVGAYSSSLGGVLDASIVQPPALSVWPLDGYYVSGSTSTSKLSTYNGINGELMAPTEFTIVKDAFSQLSDPGGNKRFRGILHVSAALGTSDTVPSRGAGYLTATAPTASQQFIYPNFVNWSNDAGTTKLWGMEYNRSWNLNYNFYRTSEFAGKNPWYDSYDDYVQDIKGMGQDHTVIPEFRISEHMDYYVDNGFSFNNRFLTLEGAKVSASADAAGTGSYNEDFFTTYSHSDFMKHFAEVSEDLDNARLSRLTLKCNGVKKLLPYQGFYPVLRTVQLGGLLSQSFGPFIGGSKITSLTPDAQQAEKLQSLLQPFFAPGIMYNTVKSGIAVDWPVCTGSVNVTASTPPEHGVDGEHFSFFSFAGDPQVDTAGGGGIFDYRMPFEALVEPQRYIPVSGASDSGFPDYRISLLYPHSGSQQHIFFDWNGKSKPQYSLAMHNFLAEVPNFFLQNQKFKSFTSAPESKFKPMVSGTTYYMDVELYKTDNFVLSEGPSHVQFKVDYNSAAGVAKDFGVSAGGDRYFANYRGAIYGPPVKTMPVHAVPAGQVTMNMEFNNIDPSFAPYTPPYFYGAAIARLAFSPHKKDFLLDNESKTFTLDEILAGAKVETLFTSSYTYMTNVLQRSKELSAAAGLSQMRVSSSINLFGKTRLKEIEYGVEKAADGKFVADKIKDSISSANDVWVISPKFECPTINVSSSNVGTLYDAQVAYDPSNTGAPFNVLTSSVATKSIWGAYGSAPTGQEGIFMRIKESFPSTGADLNAIGVQPTTGSLIDVCGFSPEQKRVGEVADEKLISEAIVAIPFIEKKRKRRFFPVLKSQIDYVLGVATKQQVGILQSKNKIPGESITNMVESMQKYVFPPHLDFLNNKNVKPFVAYIFEFTHRLDRDDLSDIWQNLTPKISTTAEKEEVVISHVMAKNEFFSGEELPPETQWMVFKVKQRANFNYFATTADSTDDDRFGFKLQIGGESKIPTYSYNWPYDFFSLVELAKLDAEAEFTSKTLQSSLKFSMQDPGDGTSEASAPTTYMGMQTEQGKGTSKSAPTTYMGMQTKQSGDSDSNGTSKSAPTTYVAMQTEMPPSESE